MGAAFGVLWFLVVAVVLAFGALQVTRARRSWEDAARKLGLHYRPGKLFGHDRITGTLDGCRVRMETFSRGSGKSRHTCTRIVVDTGEEIPRHVTLRREGFWSTLQKTFGGDDVEVGDEAFDGDIRVQGNEVQATAVLDDRTRHYVRGLLNGMGAEVRDGRVYYEQRGRMGDPHRIEFTVQAMLKVANGLSLKGQSVEAHLLHNARTDSVPAVRKRNLTLLLSHFPSSPEAQSAAHSALSDRDPSIRLQAAVALEGDKGAAVLLELVGEASAPADVRRDALRRVSRRLPPERLSALVESLLDDRDPDVRRAAVDEIGRLGYTRAFDRLVRLLDDTDEKTAIAASRTLVGLAGLQATARARGGQDPGEVEPALLRLLQRESSAAKRAAVEALGSLGTVRAVEVLLPHTRGLFVDGDLKDAARTAVARIQSRLGDVEAGRLSLVEVSDEGGGLTLVGEEGALSLEKETEAAERE